MSTRHRDMLLVCTSAALVYLFQSLTAWPLSPGRDMGMYATYYVNFWFAEPDLHTLMLYVQPLTPMFIGVLDHLGGPLLLEMVQGAMFTVSLGAVYSLGQLWDRRVGLFAAFAVMIYPSYGALFHTVGSDALLACGFILWAVYVCRAYRNPSLGRYALQGALVFVLVWIRPASQLLLLSGLLPLFITRLRAWVRVKYAVVCIGVGLALMTGWAAHNYIRYHDFVVARGGVALVPFGHLFCHLKMIQPENGPYSRMLAQAVERDLLPREPYRTYRISLQQFFNQGRIRNRMWQDLISLAVKKWGWQGFKRVLWGATWEALKAHPVKYAFEVTKEYIMYFCDSDLILFAPNRHGPREKAAKRLVETGPAASLKQPPPPLDEDELIPYARQYWMYLTPPGTKVSPERKAAFKAALARWKIGLPARDGSEQAAIFFNYYLSPLFPNMGAWLLLGALGMWLRGVRIDISFSMLLLLALGTALTVIVANGSRAPQYRLPFDPLFIIFGAAGFLAARGRKPTGEGGLAAEPEPGPQGLTGRA